jgi:CheY-like chemotaxis protein
MALKAVLMSRSQPSCQLVAGILQDSNISPVACDSAQEAIELMARGNYAALVLDFDIPGAAQVAKLARLAPAESRPVVFAMIGAGTDVGGTFEAGANFVLYKPLVEEQVLRSVRAARGFMRKDRRRKTRHTVQTVVYLLFGKAAIPTLMVDLSDEGLCIQAADPLPPIHEVPVHFLLPHSTRAIEAKAEIVWADDSGRAGMFFTHLARETQRRLKTWLRKNVGRNAGSKLDSTARMALAAAARC